MNRRLNSRVGRLEAKAALTKDHLRFAENEAEKLAIIKRWESSPYAKQPHHPLWIATYDELKPYPYVPNSLSS